MKVLHVITGLDAGGAEIQLAMLVERTRHAAEVMALCNPGPIAEQIRASGTAVHHLDMQRNTQLSALPALWRFIRDGRYDVVHAHLYRSQVYARPAARLAGTPVVVTTEHSIGETHIERRPMTRGVRSLYFASEAFSDATIAVSDVVRQRLVGWGLPPGKIVTIPNGVDPAALAFDPDARARVRAEFGIAPDAYVIGCLGRLDPNKRVDLVMEAAAGMLAEGCTMLVVGRGDDHDRLAAAADRLGIAERVIFAGYQPDSAAMLSAIDCCVAASVQETFGLSVLEALATGLPVLYTTCPALDGIETDRARKVPGDAAAIGEELRRLRQAPSPRSVPTDVFAHYGMASVVRQTDDLYDDLYDRRLTRARNRRRHAGRGAPGRPETATVPRPLVAASAGPPPAAAETAGEGLTGPPGAAGGA